MNGSPEVIAGLSRIKALTSEVHEALHDQEHLWEGLEYPKLEKVWDEANREVWDDLHHKFLKRLIALGGRTANMTENVAESYSRAIKLFSSLHDECQRLYMIVEEDDDYVTQKLLMKVQKKIESWITYLEAKLAQVPKPDPTDFMMEQM